MTSVTAEEVDLLKVELDNCTTRCEFLYSEISILKETYKHDCAVSGKLFILSELALQGQTLLKHIVRGVNVLVDKTAPNDYERARLIQIRMQHREVNGQLYNCSIQLLKEKLSAKKYGEKELQELFHEIELSFQNFIECINALRQDIMLFLDQLRFQRNMHPKSGEMTSVTAEEVDFLNVELDNCATESEFLYSKISILKERYKHDCAVSGKLFILSELALQGQTLLKDIVRGVKVLVDKTAPNDYEHARLVHIRIQLGEVNGQLYNCSIQLLKEKLSAKKYGEKELQELFHEIKLSFQNFIECINALRQDIMLYLDQLQFHRNMVQ